MKTPVKKSRGFSFEIASLALAMAVLAGCATLSSALDPRIAADEIALKSRFVKESISIQNFTLVAYSRLESLGQPLVVYIEGDGRAWLSKNHLSDDPTPVHPLVLQLAALDSSQNVAYLARPCQYTSDEPCDSSYWSNKRFSEEVIASMNQAVDRLKLEAKAKEIHLIGYSGGGAVAVLVAARRNDVASLRTIAGNLDHEAVNHYQGVSSLNGSLNPMDYAAKVSAIPQEHLVGTKDKVIPVFIAKEFAKKANNPLCVKITEVPEASHTSGWIEVWLKVLRRPLACGDESKSN